MDGVHDLGGVEGLGAIVVEADEPVFHSEWERRAFGLTFATFLTGVSNGGEFRHSIERMDAVHYLTSRYYEHWVTGIATRFVETGRLDPGDLEDRARGSFPLSRPVVETGVVADPGPDAAAFAVGDPVRVRAIRTRGHTRCPRYTRGRLGTVVRLHPPASVPDVEAHRSARVVEPVYGVEFSAQELWGTDAERFSVRIDLWARYLEPA